MRKRLLPDITTARYQNAKSAYDRRDWAAAEAQFRIVLALIDDPDNAGRLTDLRVLAAGFLELSVRAAAPPPPPVEPKPSVPQPAAAPPPVTPAGPIPGKIYTADDENVTPPIVVRQDIPGFPRR